ncbi:MAG: T9SS type A sorting domain-containing protein, partial [Bacteroidota bacterium]
PLNFALHQNYPNPFNPSTTIEYQLPSTALTTLTVYDILGKEVKILLNTIQAPGTYAIQWDAGNLPSGIYFYRLSAGGRAETKKLLFLK